MFCQKVLPQGIKEQSMTQTESTQTKRKRFLRRRSTRRQSKVSLPHQSSNAQSLSFDDDQINRYLTAQGEISFWKNFAYESPGRPFIRVTHDINMEDVSNVIMKDWELGSPRIVLVVISNVVPLGGWKNSCQLENFKKGLIKMVVRMMNERIGKEMMKFF